MHKLVSYIHYDQLINYEQTSRKPPLNVVETYIKIHKNEKTITANLFLCNRSTKLLLLLTICYFEDTLILNDSLFYKVCGVKLRNL